MAEVEDKQEDISDIDTDTNVEAGAEEPVSKSKERKKKSKFYELKAQYKKVSTYISMGWKYFKKLLKATPLYRHKDSS